MREPNDARRHRGTLGSTVAFALAALALVAILFAIQRGAARDIGTPRAVAGTLDLSSWRFDRDGVAPLAGEWGFYWRELRDPSAPLPPRPPRLHALPETWRSSSDPEVTGRGFATHTLRIVLPPDAVGRELGLTVGEVASASRLYLDGRLVRENGQLGTEAEAERPSVRPGYLRFTPARAEVDLVLQVSNFFRHDGGPVQVFDLGLAERSEAAIATAARLDYMVMGCAGVFAIYCLVLSLGRKPTDTSHLLFGCLSFLVLVRVANLNWHLVELVPAVTDGLQIRIDYITDFLLPPLYYFFLRSIFPIEFGRGLGLLAAAYAAFGIACTLLLPPHLFTWLLTSVEVDGVLVLGLCCVGLARAGLRGREGARFLALITLVILLVLGWDIARRENFVHARRDLFPYALVLVICANGATLGARLSRALARSEQLTGELGELNRSLEERVRERTAELDRLAATDALTGLLNRRSLLERAELERGRAARHGHPLSATILDADHFKRFNDEHGHDTGDRVLLAIAGVLAETLRAHDLVGRYGGEEFVIVLPHSDSADVLAVAERLRQRIGALELRSEPGAELRITVSAGVATLARDESLEELLRRADKALYAAKAAGRDAVRTG